MKPSPQAGSPAQAEEPARFESGGFAEAEINQAFDPLHRMDAAVAESTNRKAELRARQKDLDGKRGSSQAVDSRQFAMVQG